MKNDILPPKLPRPLAREQVVRLDPNKDNLPPAVEAPQVLAETQPEKPAEVKPRRRSLLKIAVFGIVGVILLFGVTVAAWYGMALRPVDPSNQSRERITIPPGSSLSSIGDQLQEKNLIRSKLAFSIHARITGAGSSLQAGTYSLSPSESAAKILGHFTSGSVDKVSITFLPGSTLRRLPGETSSSRADIESALINAGYGKEEIEAAFAKNYDHPLLVDKPADADLEGYVYGETYSFSSSSSVEQILEQTFDEYYRAIEKNGLIEGFKAKGFNLHQGITLASIIQREVITPEDQKQVAQIFLSRLKLNMSLGSDVTYQYAAKKANVPPTPELVSPYNTRKVTGLPPGPIASPGLSALKAVASPASGDYLYFLSGDDDVTYYARTSAEHEANIRNHCSQKCSVF